MRETLYDHMVDNHTTCRPVPANSPSNEGDISNNFSLRDLIAVWKQMWMIDEYLSGHNVRCQAVLLLTSMPSYELVREDGIPIRRLRLAWPYVHRNLTKEVFVIRLW